MFCNIFKFKHPTTILVAGPTQAGKTEFVKKLLQHKDTLFDPIPTNILWGYGHKNEKQIHDILTINPHVRFYEGLPDLDDIDISQNTLLILDDLMDELGKTKEYANLFTRGSHHDNITVIAIIHNIFNQQKHTRTISLNTRYYVLFKSPRDNQQIQHFGRQIFPNNKMFVSEALRQATSKRFGYLIIDLHTQTPESLRVCTGIFPKEIPLVFIPKTI